MTSYPQDRGQRGIYAMQLSRKLMLSNAANEITPESAFLVVVIAMTEDESGYSGPVKYYNSQLLRMLGLKSEDTLDRVRRRAINAGWLHYVPGGKSRPGQYWTDIPGQTDCSADHPHQCGANEAIAPQITRTSAGNVRNSCGTLYPNPIPTPLSPDGAGERTADKPTKTRKPKTRTKPSRPRQPDPLFDAVAEITGSDPAVSGSHIARVKNLLANATPPYQADDVRDFGRRLAEICPWAAKEQRRPTLGEIEKYIGRLRAGAAPPSSPPVDPQESARRSAEAIDKLMSSRGPGIPFSRNGKEGADHVA